MLKGQAQNLAKDSFGPCAFKLHKIHKNLKRIKITRAIFASL
jgi:hypothetical protein